MGAPLVITAGEPAGIGPELCLRLLNHSQPLVVIADKILLKQRAKQLNVAIEFHDYQPDYPAVAGKLSVLHQALVQPSVAGQLNSANADYVLATLRRAVAGCQTGEFSGMVTAPVHKGIINQSGIAFTGHTEFLADLSGTPLVVMMLVGGGMRVALVTTHLPLREVANAITAPLFEAVIRILQRDLVRRFGIAQPRILVAGLNPHAGEDGHLGREEIDLMIPVLNRLRAEGMQLSAPIPADTLFTPHRLHSADAVLAMYHDQGLPVLKHASFGKGVNITLGLPFIRTSVDHGTALELAGTGKAEVGSLLEAINAATAMAKQSALL